MNDVRKKFIGSKIDEHSDTVLRLENKIDKYQKNLINVKNKKENEGEQYDNK